MSRTILPNFGFEYEISGRKLPAPARALEQRFGHLLRLVPGWRDADILTETAVDDLLPWGWSPRARALCPKGPDCDVIRTVNSKSFSHAIERELGIALPGAQLVRSVDEARSAAAQIHAPWIAKHPFGVAGRDQVRADEWDETTARRLEKLLSNATELVLEPQLRIEREFSVHLDCRDPEPRVVGVVGLFTDANGTFRGNMTGITVSTEVLRLAMEAARRVMDAGYRGPLGVDGFETSDGPRAISEINARWTFGRLTLQLADMVERNVVWRHGPARERPEGLQPVPSDSADGVWLLPDWCDPEGVSGTWIELADPRG